MHFPETAANAAELPSHLPPGFEEDYYLIIAENTENYEELKKTTKSFLQIVTSNDFYYGIFLVLVMIMLVKMIDVFFAPWKRRNSSLAGFLKGCCKIFVVATIGLRIFALIPGLKDFTSQIFLSSSLLVVVLGFVFQEGLANIVHGFILSVFRPFKIGDRVSVTIDGEKITGYVREINARHTIIQNVINSAHVIVPNAKLDTSVIVNNYFDGNTMSSSFLDILVTYESDLEKSIAILSKEIASHPLVAKARKDQNITDPVPVLVRDLADSGIALRATVITDTVEENFTACSDIRRSLAERFKQDPAIDFAYPHIEFVPPSK